MRSSTEWFRDAKWGVFTHYLTGKETTVEDWNRRVDKFDVESLARQLESVGTAYWDIRRMQIPKEVLSPGMFLLEKMV